MTELLAALRPVCKLSLIRRCTGHGGVWILHLFRGYKEGRSEEGSYQLRELPHVGRDQATQSTGVWGSKRAARRCCKPHGMWNTFSGFKLVPSSMCPLSSEERSHNNVYCLWRAYHIRNTELISTFWNYLPPPSQLPSFEVSLPPIIRWRN